MKRIGVDRCEPEARPAAPGDEGLRALMGDVRGGSPDAFQHLMDRLWVELVRFAAWELADLDAAKDVVQGAFVHVWEHRRSWTDGGSPRAYLYRIVRHRITDHQRHARVRARWVEREEGRPHAGPPTPTDDLATAEVQRAFDQALSDLSPRRREVFSLVALRDLSHREVAEIMGISEQTVANQVSSALHAIRRAIREASDSVP